MFLIELLAEATGGDDLAAAGAFFESENAAHEGNRPKVLNFLRNAGQRSLDIATIIGTDMAKEAIKAGSSL